jgi:CheY-like chemotaxis protein
MKTLLIVEDDEITRGMLLEMLRVNTDWRAIAVADGPMLLKTVSVIRPDLVILDIVMDYMDGLEAHRLLREHPFGADIPVLFVTANLVKAEAAHLTGAHALLEKPFHLNVLIDKVETMLASPGAGSSRV